NRYAFLLGYKVLYAKDVRCVVVFINGTENEPFFQGHFPGYPVMAGVRIVDALAQVGAIAVLGMEKNKGRVGFLAGIDKCRFKRQVKPADQLKLEVEITRMKGPIGKGKGIATVDGEVACEAENTFAIK